VVDGYWYLILSWWMVEVCGKYLCGVGNPV